MTAVDTGWITDERPHPTKMRLADEGFHAPLDLVDGAARVYDPIVRGEAGRGPVRLLPQGLRARPLVTGVRLRPAWSAATRVVGHDVARPVRTGPAPPWCALQSRGRRDTRLPANRQGEEMRVNTRSRRVLASAVAAGASLALMAGCASSSSSSGDNGGGSSDDKTLVFGASADPQVIYGPYVSDGESLRVIDQIYETLVTLTPGTTDVVPQLAESWTASADGTAWTFKLRQGVKFQRRHRLQRRRPSASTSTAGTTSRAQLQSPRRLDVYWQDRVRRLRQERRTPTCPHEPLQVVRGDRRDHRGHHLNSRDSVRIPAALVAPVVRDASPAALKKYDADKVTATGDAFQYPDVRDRSTRPAPGRTSFESWTAASKTVSITATPTTGATRRRSTR